MAALGFRTLSLNFCCLTSGSKEDHSKINISRSRGADLASILANSKTIELDKYLI